MQTFLPYADFIQSANVLDKKRCWKQVVEAKQIIDILEGRSSAWKNHPAVLMWQGHIPELMCYFNCFLVCCKTKHKIRTRYPIFSQVDFTRYVKPFIQDSIELTLPWWFGDENFHRAMRARLIEKDRNTYLPLFPNDEGFNGGKYFWPVMETKTFRII